MNFIKHLEKKVQLHSQQTFYSALYQDDILSLFDHYHKFTIEEIIEQFEIRCDEPPPQLDLDTGIETETSRQLQFESYDSYEFDDFGLSRFVVESLLTSFLLERIATKYGNDVNFETCPGQILFMMALDTCNASVQRDITGAQAKFDSLTLDNYPGEDITELATEALRLFNILAGSYSLPLNLGTKLIKKVTNTSSEFFNRKIYPLLDEVRTLETRYRLKDPITMGNDPACAKFGPYVLWASLQDEHGKLITDSDWPALASKLPETNKAVPAPDEPSKDFECYRCKQCGHKANNPICLSYVAKGFPKNTQVQSSD